MNPALLYGQWLNPTIGVESTNMTNENSPRSFSPLSEHATEVLRLIVETRDHDVGHGFHIGDEDLTAAKELIAAGYIVQLADDPQWNEWYQLTPHIQKHYRLFL